MADALSKLPRLGSDAMGPCCVCRRQLIATGLPLFYLIELKRCGIDGDAVRKHVGLAMTMGGGADGLALASVLGPRCEPVVIMDGPRAVNVCHECAMDGGTSLLAIVSALDDDGKVAHG